MALCTLTVTAVSAQKMDQAAKNVKNYNRIWDVVVNEGRVNILDTAYADKLDSSNPPFTPSGMTLKPLLVNEELLVWPATCKMTINKMDTIDIIFFI